MEAEESDVEMSRELRTAHGAARKPIKKKGWLSQLIL